MTQPRVVLAAILLVLLGAAGPGRAQSARVNVEEENFRAEPGGSILAELLRGTLLTPGESRGQWREATLEAWIWTRSTREQRAGELDLLVNAGGENLRATPNGEKLGRARGGMRLDRVESQGDWTRVRRTGWIWAPSIDVVESAEPEATPAPAPAAASTQREFAAVSGDVVVLDAPAGDTVARIQRGGTVRVLAREGDWTRIRVEGWTFSGALSAPDSAARDILVDVPRDTVQAQPEVYRGRLVEWTIQFIALQEAERFRTEFLEGEPFILARGPGEDPGFVYVAVPSELLDPVQRLAPLQRVRVLARIRAASSELTGAPVLDLLEILTR